MSNISSLNVGLRALLAAQSGLDTAGHNIANATTPGYSRQQVLLSSSGSQILNGIAVGNGVEAGTVRRLADQFIGRRLGVSSSMLSYLGARLNGVAQLESLLGEPGDDGLSNKMQSLFASFSRLATDHTEPSLRQNVVSAGIDLSRRFHSIADGLEEVARDAHDQIRATVSSVNTLANRIASLNRSIREFEAGGQPANDMRDQREQAVKELSVFVDVRSFEGSNGSISVQVGGQLLVGPNTPRALSAATDGDGQFVLQLAGHATTLEPRSGTLAGLLSVANDARGSRLDEINTLARNLAFQLNRAHSTGMPSGGPFSSLVGAYSFADQDGDNLVTDETLANAGLTFAVSAGELRVSITNKTTGAVETTRIAIDSTSMTVGDLVSQLDSIAHLSASITNDGRLDLTADAGFGFDFTQRLNTTPDVHGTFGGQAATLGSAQEPFTLTAGATLQLTTGTGTATVTFQTTDFANIAAATVDEVAAAINANTQVGTIGARAVVVDGQVVLQTLTQGTGASIQTTSGSALTTLGFTAGQAATGQTNAVTPTISGTYTGTTNQTFTFVPTGDGVIGSTSGLGVDVFDSSGNKVATLAVGQDYVPGTPLAIGNGLSVSFWLGSISRTNGNVAAVDAVADADTSDVLAALGINALVTGTDAATFALRADIEADPSLLATSATGTSGDNGVLIALADVDEVAVLELEGQSVTAFHATLIASVAADVSSTQSMHDTETIVMEGLEARRQSIAGVNIDEEPIEFERHQQAYAAAARFLAVVNQVQEEHEDHLTAMAARITHHQLFYLFNASLQSNYSKLATLQTQISSGKRINRPSDDPLDASIALGVRGAQADVARYAHAAADARSRLDGAANLTTDAGIALSRVRELVLQGLNSTVDGPARDTIANEIEEIGKALLQIANTQADGRYVFGGAQSTSAPFGEVVIGGQTRIVWQGEEDAARIAIGPGDEIELGLSGAQLFASWKPTGTSYAGITGARAGTSQDQGSGFEQLTVRHDGTAATLGAGIALFNGGATDTIVGTRTIEVDGDTNRVRIGNGAWIGIPSVASGLRPNVTATDEYGAVMHLDFSSWTGADFTGTAAGSASVSIDGVNFTAIALTETDLQLTDSTSGTIVHVDTRQIVRAGEDLATFGGTASVFDVIQGLVADLRNDAEFSSADVQKRLSSRLTELDMKHDDLLVGTGVLAARSSRAADVQERLGNRSIDLAGRLGDLEDVDLTAAILEMTKSQQTLELVQSTGSRLLRTSLLEYLR